MSARGTVGSDLTCLMFIAANDPNSGSPCPHVVHSGDEGRNPRTLETVNGPDVRGLYRSSVGKA